MESKIGKFNYIDLSDGKKMPPIGFGTYKLADVEEHVTFALNNGYRLVDTAKLYNNEEQVGNALEKVLKEGKIKREQLFVVTKLWQDDHEDPETALRAALKRLKLDYLDLYLIHWPLPVFEGETPKKKVPLHILWGKLEQCVEKGLVRSLGVSNFNVQILLDLISYAKVPPVINQVELNPYFSQEDLYNACKIMKIKLMAYMPGCNGEAAKRHPEIIEKIDLYKNEVIVSLAKKYGRTPPQIVLNWHLHKQIIPVPRSANNDHIAENLKSADFEMEKEEYEKISSLNMNLRLNRGKEKTFCPGFEIFA